MNPTVFDAIDLMTGYQPAAALAAASRLGVFDLLAERTATSAEVAAELGTDPAATRSLLDVLVGVGMAELDGEPGVDPGAADDGTPTRYRGGPLAARLGRGGDLGAVIDKEAFLAGVWLDLDASVRTGRPRLDPWRERLASDPDQVRRFLEALVVLARETGPDLAALLDVAPGTTVADLGGGLGSYAVPLAAAGASVTLVELPVVAGWAGEAMEAVDDAATRERIVVREVDLLAEGAVERLDGPYDVVLLSHLLHDLADADAERALAVAHDLCRPGGSVVVFELPGDPPGAFGPLFDLMMRVETPGAARGVGELLALLAGAGLVDGAEVEGSTRPHAVLRARRPGPAGG